jgi:hypothetical protein
MARAKDPHLGSLGEELAHGRLVESRNEIPEGACARWSAGEGSDEPENKGELERVELPLAAG